jgi:hypothetical protein
MFLTFFSTLFLLCLHKIKFDDFLAYISFNKNQAGIIQNIPFKDILYHSGEDNENYHNTLLNVTILLICSSVVCLEKYDVICVFGIFWIFYVSFLRHIDIFRYAIPSFVLTINITLDNFIEIFTGKSLTFFLLLYYCFILYNYTRCQIATNSSGKIFLQKVLNSVEDIFH